MTSFLDRKSTRLNSSHLVISYAVFCLKKKKKNCEHRRQTARTTRPSRTLSTHRAVDGQLHFALGYARIALSYIRTHQLFFFFNDTATTEIYTLSLHDALPI